MKLTRTQRPFANYATWACETLAERLDYGPLPLEQVLSYAVEIADALDKEHRKRITHHDLKLGNIRLTKSVVATEEGP